MWMCRNIHWEKKRFGLSVIIKQCIRLKSMFISILLHGNKREEEFPLEHAEIHLARDKRVCDLGATSHIQSYSMYSPSMICFCEACCLGSLPWLWPPWLWPCWWSSWLWPWWDDSDSEKPGGRKWVDSMFSVCFFYKSKMKKYSH